MTPLAGSGKIQDIKPKSKKSEHPILCTEPIKVKESVEEGTVPNEDDGNYIRENLMSTIEKIKQMTSEGAEITKKKFTECCKT